ncbi:hypothetical protein ACJQWK_07160 [Exserohilum turcicum]
MSDRSSSSSLEGSHSPPRHRNTAADDDPQYHYESIQDTQAGAPASPLHTRRRPSRTTSGAKASPRSASPPYTDDQHQGDKKAKPPRNSLKKLLRRDSHHAELSPAPRGGHDGPDDEESTVGYIPRLGPIRERRTSMQSRRRASSTVSSTGNPKALRRRRTEDSAVSRSRGQRKHASTHRSGGKLAQLTEPSSASSVSQLSGSSSGSNSTVTLRYQDDHNQTYHYEAPGERPSFAMPGSQVSSAAAMSDVFKYLESDDGATSLASTDIQTVLSSTTATSGPSFPSTAPSTAPSDGGLGTEGPFMAADSRLAAGPNATSQTAAQTAGPTVPHLPHQEFRKFKKPLYASSFVHGPRNDDEEPPDQSGESEGSYTDSETETETETEDGNEPSKAAASEAASSAAAAASSPQTPSTAASQNNDVHAKRLRQQERELANHILKNPKPQKESQANAGTSTPTTQAYPHAPMPMYSPQVLYPAASPSVVGTPNPPQGWPPMPSPFPTPLAIGYAPHQSPKTVPAYPHSMVKQHMPPLPFSPHHAQPQRYQQHASSPPPLPSTTTTTTDQAKPPMTGYALLADELSAASADNTAPRERANIVPVYRKFEHLNHRVLLHLQDETCELEEELRRLDECIAHLSPKDPSGYAYPASRRNDARYGGELHFKRTELLGRIFQKLEQYSESSCSIFSFFSLVLR